MTDLYCKCGRAYPRHVIEQAQEVGRFARVWAAVKRLLNI